MLWYMENKLTRMHHRLERQVAALDIEREFVDVHPAGADQHLVVLDSHQTVTVDGEMSTRRGFVFLCPVRRQVRKCMWMVGCFINKNQR